MTDAYLSKDLAHLAKLQSDRRARTLHSTTCPAPPPWPPGIM